MMRILSAAHSLGMKINNKWLSHLFYVALVLAFLLACTPITPPNSSDNESTQKIVEIKIDPSNTYQVIEGFGVSGASWAQEIGGWQDGARKQVIKLLFDLDVGIGLTVYRYQIGAGGGAEIQDPWRRTESFENTQGSYDWNRDAKAVRILVEAHAAGAKQLIAFSNSPPPRLTRSGMVSGAIDGQSNLGLNKEDAFAQYLVDILTYLKLERKIPINWISPINEPEKNWNSTFQQEGCNYTPADAAYLIETLQKKIQNADLNIKIIAPETNGWLASQRYLEAISHRSDIVSTLDAIAVHSYNTNYEEKISYVSFLDKNYNDMQLWITEWRDIKPGKDTGMASAIEFAQMIHEDLTLGKVTSWQYGMAVSKYETQEGLLYTSPFTQTITETKRLWAFGNYSRFIRPGYQLVMAVVGGPSLRVSAYQAPDKDELVVVVINPQTSPVTSKIIISQGNWFKVKSFLSSEIYNLSNIYTGSLPETFTFPGLSITTLLISP
jgi:O-glycosyl hydrolase